MSLTFAGRLGIQQRVLPAYRVPFFDLLAGACEGGLGLFAGKPRASESIHEGLPQRAQHTPAANFHLLGGPLYLCVQAGLVRWLKAWDPDALIVEANPRYLSTPAAVAWMHARGRPVLGWGLGAPPFRGVLSLSRRLSRRNFLAQFDGLIAYSQRGAREYEALGLHRDRVFVATNAVAPRPPSGPVRHDPAAAPTVLFVGRLQPRKHVDFLLRACSESASPQPQLIIVGDGPARAPLETLASRIYPSAQFVGERHGAELERFFARADLFVLPGTGGLAVQQAMAHGLPVIVAQGDGTQDDLVRSVNGWQIPSGDYTALVRALRIALSDRGRLRRMGDESYRIVSEEINLESMVGAFLDALKHIVGPGSVGY